MSVSEEARRTLRELGLTGYEVSAYLSLLERGAMTASRVSEAANLPYSKVYETLNSLESKGWIKVEEGRPKRYYPKSPSEALEAAKLRFESMMKSWEQPILSELQPLYEEREIREKPDIWIIRGEFNALAKLRETLGIVKNELMIAAPALSETLLETIFPVLVHLRDAGARILFLVSKEVEGGMVERMTGVAEVRVRDRMFGGGVIVDGREVMLLLGDGEKSTLVIWSDHLGLVNFAKEYFQYLWETAGRVNLNNGYRVDAI